MNILAIDVGTSSMRGVLFDDAGIPAAMRQVRYGVTTIDKERVEQHPESWNRALREICRSLARRGNVDAVALTSQRSSVIAVDRDGTALGPAIMWQDTRNAGIVAELSHHTNRIFQKAGARPNTVYAGPKMAWIKRYEPQTYDRAAKLCTIADYLAKRMTGRFATDASYASRTLLMNLAIRRWDRELLAMMELDESKLCEIIAPGDVLGGISSSFALDTGLKEGIPLVSAGGDQQCGAMGQGVVGSGRIAATFGTGAFLLQQIDVLPSNMHHELIYGAHALPSAYTMESSMLTCAALYDWCRRLLFPEGLEVMNQEVAESPLGSGGVYVLPFFQGRATPDWNSAARGAFAGMSLSTSRGDMARAVLEAVVLEAANHVELLEGQGGKAAAICVGGGLTNQPLFPQMLADASNHQVLRERGTVEGTARGAWMSAAVALGLVQDFEEAFTVAAQDSRYDAFEPNPTHVVQYQAMRERMNDHYAKLVDGTL